MEQAPKPVIFPLWMIIMSATLCLAGSLLSFYAGNIALVFVWGSAFSAWTVALVYRVGYKAPPAEKKDGEDEVL